MKIRNWTALATTSLILALAVLATASQAEDPPSKAAGPQDSAMEAPASPFHGTPLETLAGYLGTWEIDTTWTNGVPLWSRNEFTVGIGGKFLVGRTFTKDEKGETYERYLTMFAHDAETGNFKSHGFTFDGTVAVVDPLEVGGDKGRESITTRLINGDSDLKQTVQLTSPTTYTWKVWVRAVGAKDWNLIMDGVWKKVD